MRLLTAVAVCCAVFPASSLAATSTTKSWANAQIKLVTKNKIFLGTPATFRPQDPLTEGTLARVIARLTGETAKQPHAPATPVSMAGLDAALVRALGLRDAASEFYRGARASGLKPPARFGTEVMARLLGLRLNHPIGQDNLELQPQQTATRAEAAYSVARILSFRSTGYGQGWSPNQQGASPPSFGPGQSGAGGSGWPFGHHHHHFSDGWRSTQSAAKQNVYASSWEVQGMKAEAQAFALPKLTVWQRRILDKAVSLIGDPYIWGGTAPSGMDCSGFVWRVYKLTSYPGAPQLSGILRGRTTMAMSGEVRKSKRINEKHLEPGDVMFFGNGPSSSPAQVDHAGIYLGNGWYINSSGYGVAVASLSSGEGSRFAWARRPLAEAGLT
ncbi:MAG TPA: C40 family peptidase [Gaiellaceae bacterium]|nr:C40 family peptidase [Gaiellaceae bacterium]